MALATRFEDLVAWQKARSLTSEIYRVTSAGTFSRDFGLRDQIRRASVSVMSNVAEGFERSRSGEFGHYLLIAKGSCGEVRSQLYVALDIGYLSEEEFNSLYYLCLETSRVINGLRASIVSKNLKG